MADESDPAVVADATATFCEDHDGGRDAVEAVLAVDTERDTWSFDDVPLDSGTFGELVSRGIVTKDGGEYRISSPDGVTAALEGDEVSSADESRSGRDRFSGLPAVDARAIGALTGALALLVGMRLLTYQSVFRDGNVVLRGNDPYYYRYWMEELLAESDGITDWSVVGTLPQGAVERRPLTHATNWFVAELLGGDQWAADMVAAWLPVVATLALGIVLYWLAVVVTDDVRVGVTSVFLLALTPIHAVYTGVGFLEHRLHQYFWLGVTLLSIAWIVMDLKRRRDDQPTVDLAIRRHLSDPRTWIAVVASGIALSFSIFAWGGSVLMLVPVAAYLGLKVVIDVREGVPPVRANASLLAGVGVCSLVSIALHFRVGWHEAFAGLVPLLVVIGGVAVVGLGEVWRRFDRSSTSLLGFEIAIAGLGTAAFRSLRPDDWARLLDRSDDLFFREHHGATELGSLFTTENSVIFEPMAQIGLHFYIALVALGWCCWSAYKRYEPGWLLLASYGLVWLVLATIQMRFAAQLMIPLSVLGGMGLVYLFSWVDLARLPKPLRESDGARADRPDPATDGGEYAPSIVVPRNWRKLVTLVWVALLICGMSLIFLPSLSAQTTYSDAEFGAAMAIDEHAETADREYPENFVLSTWGDNRMYNYFVNGESQSYGYAASNFEEFQTGSDPDGWYDQFEDRVGYVVLTDQSDVSAEMTQSRLHEEYGTGGNQTDPLAHYQAVYLDEEVTAFAVVPGATITGSGEAGENVTVETETVVSGETLTYEQSATVGDDGTFSVTVPYPGEYDVGTASVDVSRSAVESGESVPLN
ncbi:hypothetical protein [Natrialba asiatica]|uniref:dolichyl-phosphooligosaccharide-protein glycotransferase n=1 Tax=Natrialba asiatica (strain ATCC 700177 / DSM 12278 / JCM 9576 / FERM P-10747 / NBRC 102637 / 172P1) TaxID=29540 RepID=M0ASY6_NATA1|nr:hypothetical protein [Natrialba asiatica]ELZ01826.1 hypothetical protein C481_09907 [Natrialba asiatica DSM 12278]